MSSGLEYIRDYYGVPAAEGARIRYSGDPAGPVDATIVGSSGPHLLARFDDATAAAVLHPTWQVQYLDAPGNA